MKKEIYMIDKEIKGILKNARFQLTEAEAVELLNKIKKKFYEKNYEHKVINRYFLAGAFSFCAVLFVMVFSLYFFRFYGCHKVKVVSGNVSLKKNLITGNYILRDGDRISTSEKESCEIKFVDIVNIKLFENSTLKVDKIKSENAIFELHSGKAFFQVEKKEKPYFVVRTRFIEILVKGTVFEVEVSPSNEIVMVTSGAVIVSNLKNSTNFAELQENEIAIFTVASQFLRKLSPPFRDKTGIVNWSEGFINSPYFIAEEKQKEEIIEANRESFIAMDDKIITFDRNTVYVFSTDRKLYPRRKINLRYPVKDVVGNKRTLYITSENGGLYTYSLDGEKLWENNEAGVTKYYSKPVIFSNLIFLATIDKGIQIFNNKGNLIDRIIPESGEAIYNSPLVLDENSFIFFTEKGNLIRYDLTGKTNIWKMNFKESILPPFMVNDNLLFIYLKNSGRILSINVENGKVLWSFNIKNIHFDSFHVFYDYLVAGFREEVFVFNKFTGEVIKNLIFDFKIKQMVMEKNKIYLLTESNNALIYNIPGLVKIYEKKFGKDIIKFSHLNRNIFLVGDDVLLDTVRE